MRRPLGVSDSAGVQPRSAWSYQNWAGTVIRWVMVGRGCGLQPGWVATGVGCRPPGKLGLAGRPVKGFLVYWTFLTP